MYLNGGSVAVIESNAFYTVRLSGDMNLQSNNISVIKENGFYEVSCRYLYLHNNPVTKLEPFTFNDVGVSYNFVMYSTQLRDIPSSAFNGVTARNLYLYNNPVTSLASYSFNNTRVTNAFSMYNCQIETIMSRAFNDLTAETLSLYNNPVTTRLESFAFNNVRVTDFLMYSCAFATIASRTFNDVSARNLFLYGNSNLTAIAEEAFSSVNVWSSLDGHGRLDLSNCAIRVIVGKMFTPGSRVKELILRNNQLRYIGARAFEEIELRVIDIRNNLLVSIPETCFHLQSTVQKLDLTNNTISSIGDGAFDNLLSLEQLLLGDNNLQVFYKPPDLPNLVTVDISKNEIEFVEENAFNILATNETFLYLTGNPLACSCSFYKTMRNLSTTIFGGSCSTPEQLINITFDSSGDSSNYFANFDSSDFLCAPTNVHAVAESNREISVSWDHVPDLDDIQSVNLTNATMGVINGTETNTTNSNQTMLNETVSNTTDFNQTANNTTSFNVTANNTTSFNVTANNTTSFNETANNTTSFNETVNNTTKSFNETVNNTTTLNQTETNSTNVSICNITNFNQSETNMTSTNNTNNNCFNQTQANDTDINDEQLDQVSYPYYLVTCTSETAPTISRGLIVTNFTMFNASDGVQAGTTYTCAVLYNQMGDFSASSWPVTVTTLQETEDIDENSMQVPISYYDFSITHPDFDGRRQGELLDPTYMVNPFGGYLSTSDDPTLDPIARWFVSVPGDNFAREETLVLTQQNGTDVYRFYDKDFFPVDGFGYGFEGQRDCNNTLHNFGFTAAVRAALTYTGNEIITVGGGDELWLFVDRKRVIDLRREKGDKSEITSCRRLTLQGSRSEGGTVIDGECVIHGNATDDTVELELTVGNTYHLDVFVAEREPCASSLFLEVEDVVLSFPVVDISADNVSSFATGAPNIFNSTNDSLAATTEELSNTTTLPTLTPETATSTGPPYSTVNHTEAENNIGNHTEAMNTTTNYTETTEPPVTSNLTAQQNISTTMSSAEPMDRPAGFPVDYEPRIPEDLHQNGIVQTVSLASVASTDSLFTITILEGNDGGHFTIKNDTDENRADAEDIPTQNVTWVTVDGTSFVVCNQTVVETTSETVETDLQKFVITTRSALITLAAEVDYEDVQQYELVLVVEDNNASPGRTGTLAIEIFVEDVNDNCPSFTTKEFDVEPRPVLSPGPVFTLQWVDRDSRPNAIVSIYRTQEVQQTYLHQLQFSVIAVDSGTPPRGDIATVSMTISDTCLYDSLNKSIEYDVSVENHTGNVYLRVPKYYVKTFVCFEPLGMESGWIHISQISASSADEFYGPDRSRLNNNASIASDGGTHAARGNWRAAVTNADQWLQVSFLVEVVIKAVVVQGSFDAQEWVQTYILLYSNDSITWQTYKENGTVKIFNGSTDASTPQQEVLLEPITTSHIRINPQSWRDRISMRIALIGCTVRMQHIRETTCARCPTAYYCTGDGVARPCGRCDPPSAACERSPTEHSFGGASECSPCPIGRICKDGYGHVCRRHHYALPCNETDCPDSCTPCEPGYACFFGRRYQCRPGFYGTGRTDYCVPCPAGSYNNQSGATGCFCCPPGFYSTVGKTECEPCHPRTWSRGDCTICRDCRNISECPCLSSPCFGDVTCQNINSSYYVCGACPPGYSGNGVTCVDVDECNITSACHGYCENTNPGYVCGACPKGYSGDTAVAYGLDHALQHPQVCEDVDECAIENGGCHQYAECVNTLGSYQCGNCIEGYISDIYLGCIPEDLCQLGRHNCSSNATCLSLGNGKFRCKCNPGYGGDGYRCGPDTDQDGWPDEPVSCLTRWCKQDNCPLEPNSGQEDNDGDNKGDVCDQDDDNDGRLNPVDNCIFVSNWDQKDTDGDGYGDVCDTCPLLANQDQTDTDGDGTGNECDDDDDGDGLPDTSDPCPLLNDTQSDTDGDCVGDASDNCPNVSNANQQDSDMDGYGDACDGNDKDGDTVIDTVDNCVDIPNAEQTDTDSDGIGDACDDDIDNDVMPNDRDNCPYIPNPGWVDTNGNHVGDACEYDYDGDGVPDVDDVCPKHSNYHVTSFAGHVSVNLAGGAAPTWAVTDDGREIRLTTHTDDPVVLIGNDRFGPVNLTGTMFVSEDSGNDYIGFVFGYQSNRKFYVVIWKHENENAESSATYGGIKGLQIKVVDSSTGPSSTLADALWHTHDTASHVTMLWHDPDMRGWIHRTPYTFQLMHRPSVGLIRVTVSSNRRLLTDSGNVYDTTILGGRLGVFQYNQSGVIWSNLQIACGEKVNQAIHFDGKDDYVELASVIALELYDSFTIESWIRLTGEAADSKMPVICTLDNRLCMFVENGFLYGRLGTSVVQSNTDIPAECWCHITLLYDAQEWQLSLYINGSLETSTSAVTPLAWTGNDTNVYIGRDENDFFNGTMDDIRLYGIKLQETEIAEDARTSDRLRQFHRGFLNAQFTVDNEKMDATMLLDVGIHGHHGKIVGSPVLVPSAVDQARHQLPSAKKRRRRSAVEDAHEEL
ncbi:uncharacterized protein LOC144859992 [Branchiostoma floridae x Branchiostoma japonicum]